MIAPSFPRSFRPILLVFAVPTWFAACANSTFEPDPNEVSQGGSAGTSAGAPSKGGSAGAAGKGGKTAGSGGDAGTSAAGTGGAAAKGGAAGKGGGAGKGGSAGGGNGGEAGASAGGKGGSAGKGGAAGSAGASGKGGSAGKAGSGGVSDKGGSAGTDAGAGGSAQGGAPPLCVYAPDEDAQTDDACFTCWNETIGGESCKDARAACDGDPSCAEVFQCVVSCPGEDSSCEKKCGKPAPDKGKELYEALRDCVVQGACKDACQDHFSELLSLDMCKHDVCTTGMILYRDCSPEADAICAQDATCCGGFDPEWGNGCVAKAENAGYCPVPGCVHAPCAPGAPILDKACSPCVSAICDQFPLCCSPLGKWDPACANAVATVCKDL